MYAPSDDAIAHMREHVNLQKRSAEGKLAEHGARHALSHAKQHGYTPEEHNDAAEHHGREALNYNNSDKVRALHRHIADAHKAKANGQLTPAGQAEKDSKERAAKREEKAKAKESKREKTSVATTEGGHEIKNTHHIRFGGFGPELKEGPGSKSARTKEWMPVETELGDHLTHEQHKDIAAYHHAKAGEHQQKQAHHWNEYKRERATGKYDNDVNHFEQHTLHRNASMNHKEAAAIHEKAAASKPSSQQRAESAGQLTMFKSNRPNVRKL